MKKRAFTLMEIMIVIFLIGIIGSVISYNMRGSLERGKAFKTEQAIAQVTDILEMEVATGSVSAEDLVSNPESIKNAIKRSGMIKDPGKLLKDGWNQDLDIRMNKTTNNIMVSSQKLSNYYDKLKKLRVNTNPTPQEAELDDTSTN